MKKILALIILSSSTFAFDSGYIVNLSLISHTATEESKNDTSTTTYGSERTSSEWFSKMGFQVGAGYRFFFSNGFVLMPELHYQSIGQDIKAQGYNTSIDSNYGFSLSLGYNFGNFLPYLKLQKHNKVKFTHSNNAIANGEAKDLESGEKIGSGTDVVALGFGTDIELNSFLNLRFEYIHTKPLEYIYENNSQSQEQRITQDSFHLGVIFNF